MSWLPVFHDMGLVYGALQFAQGFPCFLLPASFLQRPIRWLRLFRASGALMAPPQFAYDLCVSTTTPDSARRLISTAGSHPQCADPFGGRNHNEFPGLPGLAVSPSALCPGYGLAETSKVTPNSINRSQSSAAVSAGAFKSVVEIAGKPERLADDCRLWPQ